MAHTTIGSRPGAGLPWHKRRCQAAFLPALASIDPPVRELAVQRTLGKLNAISAGSYFCRGGKTMHLVIGVAADWILSVLGEAPFAPAGVINWHLQDIVKAIKAKGVSLSANKPSPFGTIWAT